MLLISQGNNVFPSKIWSGRAISINKIRSMLSLATAHKILIHFPFLSSEEWDLFIGESGFAIRRKEKKFTYLVFTDKDNEKVKKKKKIFFFCVRNSARS